MNKLKNYNPEFKSVNDAIAFGIHLAFLESNCQLVGLNENQYLEDIGSIPAGWNKSNQMYAFRYILKSEKGKNDNNNKNDKNDKNDKNNKNNNEKAKKEEKEEKKEENGDDDNNGPCYLVKILSLGNDLLMASGVKQGTNDISTLDITISDHLCVDSKQANKDKSILKNYEKLYKNLNSLLLLIKDSIVDKVVPSKEKEKDKSKEKDKNNDKNKNKKTILIDDDDFAPIGPIGGGIGPIGGGIGGGIRPGGDFGGDIGGDFGGIGGMGGNWMGPNHGRFQNPNANNNNNNNNNGGIGGIVPPGAKYDPPGPGPLGGGHIGPDPDHEQMPGRNNQDWLAGGGIGQGFGARRQQPRGGGGGFGGFGGGGGGFGGFV